MSQNTQHDSLFLEELYLPYDKSLSNLSGDARILSGQNSLITSQGSIQIRPGAVGSLSALGRLDRLWEYETIEEVPKLYLIGSFFFQTGFSPGVGEWRIRYIQTSDVAYLSEFTSAGSYRAINASTRPHELVVHGGVAYIKGFPAAASSEKLGTVIFDGTGGTVTIKPWGILGPTIPARIDAQVTKTSAAIDNSTTSLPVSANFTSPPATPFIIYVTEPGVSEEYMIVTTGGASP